MTNFESIKNIVFLEPKCSFSEMAKDKFCEKYKLQCQSTPMKTIKQIVDYVAQNPDTLGVLPVENTLDGTIRESLDCIISSQNPNIRILAEITLPIEYCLLSKTTEFYSITGIIATPRLLSKCQEFINKEMPYNLNVLETATINEAAMDLANHNLTYSAIGNKKIAENYRLNILKENIHDDKNNRTKYILIGDIETTPTEKDRTTVAFRTNHTPGALLKILKIFLENEINLSYISSRASKYEDDEYIFIVSFDGHIQGSNLLKAINEIRPNTSFFRYLGSYKIWDAT
ncbi:MAG: ACT domain-containing protein [Muribaculaceae bacterium]|nr:ACT domain-containing protein [Muribaculaceae bacterium]